MHATLPLLIESDFPLLKRGKLTTLQDNLGKLGIVFNQLFTLTNMPIKRFGSMLVSKGLFDEYMGLLRRSHQDDNLEGVMCRSLIRVDWRGKVCDCDFNQMLDLPMSQARDGHPHLSDLLDTDLRGCGIDVADHCYACTAGQGQADECRCRYRFR